VDRMLVAILGAAGSGRASRRLDPGALMPATVRKPT